MKRISINISTKQGKRSTIQRGIDIREFAFNRMRRRKNASLGVIFSAVCDTSRYEGSRGGNWALFFNVSDHPI